MDPDARTKSMISSFALFQSTEIRADPDLSAKATIWGTMAFQSTGIRADPDVLLSDSSLYMRLHFNPQESMRFLTANLDRYHMFSGSYYSI